MDCGLGTVLEVDPFRTVIVCLVVSWDNCSNFNFENRSDSKTMAATVKANMSLLGAPGSGESDWHECSKEVDQFVTGYDCSRPRDQNAIIDRGRTHIY